MFVGCSLTQFITEYLTATGWIVPAQVGEKGGLWRHPQSDYLLPIPNELTADGVDWHVITERLAMVEDSEVTDVLARIDRRWVDIANVRAANDIVIRDTIPYSAGVTLVRESWGMLRSSATTSLGPQPFIRKYRQGGDEIVASARMAHTRRGSFIIPIHLPIRETDRPKAHGEETNDSQITGLEVNTAPEPVERRVMRTFAESLSAINTVAVEPKREPSADGIHDLIRAGVSHQFASSLDHILSEKSVDQFSVSFEWSAAGGPPPQGINRVEIPSSAAEVVRLVAMRLKVAPRSRGAEEFVGPIRRVERDPHSDTGTVTVQAIKNGRPARVSVNVSAEVLDQAWQWARDRKTVVVQSRVHPSSDGLMADTADAVTPLMVDAPVDHNRANS
jgi:hypothetical protein